MSFDLRIVSDRVPTSIPPAERRIFPALDVPPLHGRVIDAGTQLPLAGVVVRWIAPAPGNARRGFERSLERSTILGEAVSGADGAFELALAASQQAELDVCAVVCRPDAKSYLVGLDSGRKQLSAIEPVEVTAVDDEIVLQVASDEQLSESAWRALSKYLASNRLQRMNDLAQQLAQPFADGPVYDWSAAQRSGALSAVSRALEPEADGGSRPSALLDMEHPLNLDALAKGNVDKAVNNFRSLEQFQRFGGTAEQWLGGKVIVFSRSDSALYRDYLRGVWVTAAQRMHGPGASDAALEQQLDTRFHQEFTTPDDTPRPVHKLLIALLRSVLLARADREGFGFSAATLPAQGTASEPEYVQTLIAASGESSAELRNRFRVRFDRPADEFVSPIALNVEALLGLLADTYQSPEEPFATGLRGIEPERPLIFAPYNGRAPFFLQFGEWLDRQRKFYPENVYDIRRTLPVFDQSYRDVITAQSTALHVLLNPNNDYIASQADWQASAKWIARIFGITDAIRAALKAADKQAYPDAAGLLDAASNQIYDARKAAASKWERDSFLWFSPTGVANSFADRRVSPKARAARPVSTSGQLAEFEQFFDARTAPYVAAYENGPGPGFADWMESWLSRARTLYLQELSYFEHVLIPYLRSTLLSVQGDHVAALKLLGHITGYDVGIARTTDAAGYAADTGTSRPPLYRGDALPYTTSLAFDAETAWYTNQEPHAEALTAGANLSFVPATARPLIAPFEQRFFKLAQGESMLAWAEQLYRTDDSSAIRRARELYKGVIFMHGEDAGIAPNFPVPGLHLVPGLLPLQIGMQTNPARSSQLARARAKLWQIEQGLNVYGYRDDMVPVLRYKPLKQAADVFAASGKSAQSDFLEYQTRFEQASIEGWQAAMMVKKSQASLGIASEHAEIAKVGVAKAQEQVAAVKAQIAAKQAEIAAAGSFFGQAKDFFGGIKDSLTGLVPLAEKAGNDQSPASAGANNEQLAALLGKSFSGASASKDAAAAALGSGAALTIGFAAFAYYGYTTLEGMAGAMARRDAELKALETTALAAAEAQVVLKQRDVTLAGFEKQIAQAELDFALALERYQRDRFLNVDVWNKLAGFAQRTMKRYIELGARAAWLAERALAFEQNRVIQIIRLDYVPTAMRGLTGADRLLLDLSELEAYRLQGVRLTTPIKHTLSLARDVPLAFGQLKRTGRCTFRTEEAALQTAYPGTYAYRLRAITVAAHDADGPAPRGILRNLGASLVSDETGGSPKLLVRFTDALPLSEFRLQQDMWVYGLPGETLLQFEGSGYETHWELELPARANPRGLRSLSDVLITCDMNAMYSQALATKLAALPPAPVAHSIALAASTWDPAGLASLHTPGTPARIRFDVSRLALAAQETKRTISNVALLFVGKTTQQYAATLDAEVSGDHVVFSVDDGLALSNAGPLLGTAAALPLNDLVDETLDQAFVLEIDKTGVIEELAALNDVVLYIEYTADLV